MNGNDRFLNVNDAHLRVTGGNVHASSFNLDQISITTTSTTSSTIDFLNETKAFNARSNIEVGTANLFVDTTTSNVGIHTSSPEFALDVHGTANVSVLTAASNVGILTTSPEYTLDVHGTANVGVLTANTITGSGGTLLLGSHIIPTQHQQFDIGSAEYKIRHLYLSNNSLWIGDDSKISVVDGKMKFLKRDKNIVPSGTEALGGNATDALAHAKISNPDLTNINQMKLEHWLAYTKTLPGGEDKDIKDIFTTDTSNYESVTASEAFKEHDDTNIYSLNKLRLGSAAAAGATLDVVGTIKATSDLTVNTDTFHVDTTNSRVGVGTTSPQEKLHLYGAPMIQHDTTYQYVGSENNPTAWYKLGVWEGSDSTGQGANLKLTLLGGSGYHGSNNNKSGETVIHAKLLNNQDVSVANIGGMFYSVGNPVVHQVKFKQVDTNRNKYEVHAEVVQYTQHNMSIECSMTTSFTRSFTASSDPGIDPATVREAKFTHIINESGNVGIGTTTPEGPLHLFKSAPNNGDTGPGILFTRYSDTYGGCIWTESNNNLDGLYFNTFTNSAVSTHYGGTPAMVINSNGRVGVGTNNPATKLHLYDTTNEPTIALQHLSGTEYNTSTNVLGNLALHYSARSGGYSAVGIRSIRRASTWDDQADMEFYVRNGGHGEQTAMVINSASTSGGAKVGINTTNPLGKLDIYQGNNVSMGGPTQQLADPAPSLTLTSSSAKWAILINTNDDLIFTSHGSLSGNYVGVTGYILEGAYDQRMNDFTGQHRCFLAGVKASEIVNKTGLIVCANKNQYTMISNKTLTGQEAIDISESIPNVSISHKAYDKTCFGVISDVEDPEKREDVYGVWGCPFPKENGDDRVYINSVGEGAIWVVNTNGSLESGDYITTSDVAGYGQKQDSEFLANYTVAKITMDCDFEPVTQYVQVIKKDEEGENILDEYGQIQWEDHPTETEKAYKIRYLDADGNITDETNAVHKAAFVGCTYHCG